MRGGDVRTSGRGSEVAGGLLGGPQLAWAALFLNLMAFLSFPLLIPIPGPVGQLVAQAALPLALIFALLANPGGVVRPSVFMGLLTTMAVVALLVSIHNEFVFGATYRAVRLLGFVVVLWLLTPWWGRADMPLLRAHLSCLRVILASVAIGAVLAPGKAFSYNGRLSGAIWPIPPPQVAHYAAILVGCTTVLWFCRGVSGRTAIITAVVGFGALLASHTRTALLGLFIGLILAGLSLFVGHVRVRRAYLASMFVITLIVSTLGPVLRQWALRGQSTQEASQLTGRTKVWDQIAALPRSPVEYIFGNGLSNKSFNGLSIDSNWYATYLDLGWFGVGMDIVFLVLLIFLAFFFPRGARRALAIFIVIYCLVASFTETGLGDASPYLLELFLAASLLARPVGRASP